MALDLDLQRNVDDYQVQLIIPREVGPAVSVEGWLTQESSFSGSAEYSAMNPLNSDLISGLLQVGGDLWNAAGGDIPNRVLGNGYTSLMSWNSSSNFSFPIEFSVVSIHPEDDVTKMISPLWETIYPAYVGDSLKDFGTKVPMGYKTAAMNMNPDNVIKCWLGDWFFCPLLIMTDLNITYSKERVTNGSHLYANVSGTLQTPRMVSAEEVKGYFRGAGNLGRG